MRRDQYIRRRPEWIILGQWLWISHIESSAPDLLHLQRLDKRFLVYDLASRNVNNICAAWVTLVQ